MTNRKPPQSKSIAQVLFMGLMLLVTPVFSYGGIKIQSVLFTIEVNAAGEQATMQSTDDIEVSARVQPVDAGQSSVAIDIRNKSNDQMIIPLTMIIGTSIKPFSDPGGGYGSELYATREAFVIESGEQTWFGWQNRYDIEAIRSNTDIWAVDITTAEHPELQPLTRTLIIEPGKTGSIRLDYIASNRNKTFLSELNLDAVLLGNLWDWFRWLCLGIWMLLDLLFGVVGNWGGAIILLALIIRLCTIPVTKISLEFQQRAMAQQQRMAPKIAAIKQDFAGIELSEKMIALYEDEHYDHMAPFKGMLGLFIQIPILIALFTVIGEMSELRGAAFLWINDLSLSDRLFSLGVELPFFGGYFNALPFLMAFVTILSTWQAARRSAGKTPAYSLFGMALVFFVFFYSFPAALVLYWFSSNLFQLIQQSLQRTPKADESV
jgi:YidC/Oxa1 family membrane protein insertase